MSTELAVVVKIASRVDVPPSELFDALSHEDRRRAVSYLVDRDESVAVSDLAAHLPGSDDRAALRLHHVHLPKLSASGVVDYDRDRDRVALAGASSSDDVPPTMGSQDD